MAGPTYVVYQVVSSRDGIVNDCFRCMNNHLPGYCRARYVYETRRYTEYDEDGEIVSEWMQTVSLFMGCE